MRWDDLAGSARDALTVSRVFGEPYERDGVTVIPAAAIRGGVGGGSGTSGQSGESGEGGGVGMIARPAGAYVIRNGEVTWQPAIDVNRIVTVSVVGWVVAAWLVTRGRFRPSGR